MAVGLGRADVDRMLEADLTAKQFLEWEAFLSLEPFAFNRERRADLRAAQIVQAMYNIHCRSKKEDPAYKLEQFELKFTDFEEEAPTKKEMSVQEQETMIRLMAAALAGPR